MRGNISSAFPRLLYEFLKRRGHDPVAVLGRPEPEKDAAGRLFIPIADWADMLERADRFLGVPALGLQVGATIEPHHVGLVAFLCQHCATLGQAMHRHTEFERLYWDGNRSRLSLELTGAKLVWDTDHGLCGRLVDECSMAAIVEFCRRCIGIPDAAPTELRLIGPPPPSTQPYEDFFRCPVVFDVPKNVLRVPYGLMLKPMRNADPALFDVLEAQARERLATLPLQDAFVATLQDAIASQLVHGAAAQLADIAARLNCSPRTLQRRLDERGASFQTLLDQTRERLAESYLADRALKLAEVALLLGYSEQAAFTRAFVRWKGTTPARWRAASLAAKLGPH